MVLLFIFRVRLLQEKTTVVNDLCRLYAAVPSSNSTWGGGWSEARADITCDEVYESLYKSSKF